MISVSFQDVEGYDKDDIIDETSPSYLFFLWVFSVDYFDVWKYFDAWK
jgi:hypothetical protein